MKVIVTSPEELQEMIDKAVESAFNKHRLRRMASTDKDINTILSETRKRDAHYHRKMIEAHKLKNSEK